MPDLSPPSTSQVINSSAMLDSPGPPNVTFKVQGARCGVSDAACRPPHLQSPPASPRPDTHTTPLLVSLETLPQLRAGGPLLHRDGQIPAAQGRVLAWATAAALARREEPWSRGSKSPWCRARGCWLPESSCPGRGHRPCLTTLMGHCLSLGAPQPCPPALVKGSAASLPVHTRALAPGPQKLPLREGL